MREMISYEEALEIVLSAAPPVASEEALVDHAVGRVLAADVVSSDDLPPFDNSAMDGFAVQTGDFTGLPAKLAIIDEIPAGSVPNKKVTSGNCSRIMTGALMPEGADAVVPVEWTSETDSEVTIGQAPSVGQNIRLAGGDVTRGTIVASRGDVITPPMAGLLAAAGAHSALVATRPTVAVVATGDELISADQPLGPGKIRNSNGPALAAQVVFAGAELVGPYVARDSAEAVEDVLSSIESADILVFAGGVSVGTYDFVQQGLESRGMETVFWRVKQRPGKPLLFGRLGDKPVFGLPGNPVSASVCFEVYVRPLIEKTLGAREDVNRQQTATVEGRIEKKAGLHYFARGTLSYQTGSACVKLAGPQASNVYSTMARANCLIHLPEKRELMEDGDTVVVTPFPWTTI